MAEQSSQEGLGAERTGDLAAILPWKLTSFRADFLGRGSDEALFSEEKRIFSEKGGGIQ